MKSKKVFVSLAIVIMVCLMSASLISAIQTPNKSTTLYSSYSSAATSTVYGYYKEYAAKTYSSSSRGVVYSPQYSSGSGWITDSSKVITLEPGATVDFIRTTVKSSTYAWRLRLTPSGATSGGYGSGWIWYDMDG